MDKVIIEIQKAKNNVAVVPMSEGSLMYKIISNKDNSVIQENITKQQAESVVQQAKNKLLLG